MADQQNPNPSPEAATPRPAVNGGAPRPSTSPRAAVNETNEGYPGVDTLSYDPEDGDWVARTRLWIEQNPTLALAAAAAAGLVIGGVVAAALPERRPETPAEMIERRAREFASHGREFADDASVVIAKQLAIASDALGEASRAVATNAKKGYVEAKDFGGFLADTIGQAISSKAADWLNR